MTIERIALELAKRYPDWEQVLADVGVKLLTVSHVHIEKPYQCPCGWRGRAASQQRQHIAKSARHQLFDGIEKFTTESEEITP